MSPLRERARRFLQRPGSADLSRYQRQLPGIAAWEETLRDLPDEELATRAANAEDDAEFCAIGREAARRALGERPYDVQILGTLVMLRGMVAEMATGEGKTLSGALAAARYALQGRYVHVVSVNDYLARRDAEWMRPVYDLLGVTVGWIGQDSTPEERRIAYEEDVTYAPVSELGFDVLRDRLVTSSDDIVATEPDVALVDEADSVLIDEALVPLVLAGTADEAATDLEMAEIARTLVPRVHFKIEDDGLNVQLTDAGARYVERVLGGRRAEAKAAAAVEETEAEETEAEETEAEETEAEETEAEAVEAEAVEAEAVEAEADEASPEAAAQAEPEATAATEARVTSEGGPGTSGDTREDAGAKDDDPDEMASAAAEDGSADDESSGDELEEDDFEDDEDTGEEDTGEESEPDEDDSLDAADRFDLYAEDQVEALTRINVALHAQALVHRDIDYIVRDGKVHLINASRGRVAQLQRWPDGLQAAVEAKEALQATDTGEILDSITVESLIRRYPLVCGMTGTAVTVGEELRQFYGLEVAVIPTNRPVVRKDEPDRLYATLEQKDAAVVEEVSAAHETGRPILIGTLDIAESERLSELLTAADLPHVVLNAKNDAEEAAIVAEAGAYGAITVSTQMAGRGTDIRLGGRKAEAEEKAAAEADAQAAMDAEAEAKVDAEPDAEAQDEPNVAETQAEASLDTEAEAAGAAVNGNVSENDDSEDDDLEDEDSEDDDLEDEDFEDDEDEESEPGEGGDGEPFDAADKIAELGGLYVIGTGRHPSRRLDDQLRGRAGRQGDPGGSVFFVSMQDELITRYAPDTAEPRHVDDEGLVSDSAAQSAVGHAQRVAEGVHLEIHSNTFRYNKLIDDQRRVLLKHRDLVLETDAALVSVGTHSPERFEELSDKHDEEVLVRAARQIMLYHLDRAWADHLATLAEIREGIHLRALGHGPNPFIMSLDPLTEFHAEAVKLFGSLVNDVEKKTAETFETAEITEDGVALDAAGLKRPSATWTYLVQDNPFGTAFDRALRWLTGSSASRSR